MGEKDRKKDTKKDKTCESRMRAFKMKKREEKKKKHVNCWAQSQHSDKVTSE